VGGGLLVVTILRTRGWSGVRFRVTSGLVRGFYFLFLVYFFSFSFGSFWSYYSILSLPLLLTGCLAGKGGPGFIFAFVLLLFNVTWCLSLQLLVGIYVISISIVNTKFT
jgi:hypothetical protein